MVVSAPKDHPYTLPEDFKVTKENKEKVKKDGRVAFALRPKDKSQYADTRVFEDLKLDNEEGDMLVIFSSHLPCNPHCAEAEDDHDILEKIASVVMNGEWRDTVFVFEKLLGPGGNKFDKYGLNLTFDNIAFYTFAIVYRCYNSKGEFKCANCNTAPDKCID